MRVSSLFVSLSFLFSLNAHAAPQLVSLNIDGIPSGSIVVKERERALYLKIDSSRALRYRVAVPKSGMEWSGSAFIAQKIIRPAWSPPAVVKRANPRLPDVIPSGAPNNPMGEAALVLNRDELAIHGTSRSMRNSIGTAASFGCIRMLNEDILDLYDRVQEGTQVYMQR